MKISLIQADLVWEDKNQNLKILGKLIEPLYNNSDIVILPEMFNTGFSLAPERLCESPEGETLEWMKGIANKGKLAICGSYIVSEEMNYYNRFVFVSPEEKSWHYDKRHLFSIGGEDKLFSRGKNRLVFSFRGLRIAPYICYDLRFPVWSRSRNDCDLIIYTANWPEPRINVWNSLLMARAIENQCFVAGVNRIGTDGNGIKYCGESAIIDARGSLVVSAGQNEQSVITGEISLRELSDFRRKFPVADDADEFTITL